MVEYVENILKKFGIEVVLENNNGSLTPLSVEGLPLLRSLLQSRHA